MPARGIGHGTMRPIGAASPTSASVREPIRSTVRSAATAARLVRDAGPWLAAGTLVREADRLRIPAARMLVSDAVIEALFDA